MVARSSTKAEYRALANATTNLVWIQNLLAKIDIHLPTQSPILWSDKLGAKALACNLVFHARTKHIELDVHIVHSLVVDQKLEVRYVPIESQPTNLLIKALPLA